MSSKEDASTGTVDALSPGPSPSSAAARPTSAPGAEIEHGNRFQLTPEKDRDDRREAPWSDEDRENLLALLLEDVGAGRPSSPRCGDAVAKLPQRT
jgi:hypothetical protein